MTKWYNLSREEAKNLGIEGQYELMQMEDEELPKSSSKKTKKCPTEFQEQVKLAEYLDIQGYCWCHVPNGGNRDAKTGAKMKKQGVKPGVPDVLIFDGVDHEEKGIWMGIAIELKRQKGGQLQDSQEEWLQKLEYRGWLTKVCEGADEAIDFLEGIFGDD